jgi:hypothetical protein
MSSTFTTRSASPDLPMLKDEWIRPFLTITYEVISVPFIPRLIWLERNFTPVYARVIDVRYGRIHDDEVRRRLMRTWPGGLA